MSLHQPRWNPGALGARRDSRGLSPRPTLWLTCDDPAIERLVAHFPRANHAIVLRRTVIQRDESRDDAVTGLEIIDRLLEMRRPGEIIICGHSLCTAVHPPPPCPKHTNGYQALLARVQQRLAWQRSSRERLLRQLRFVEELPGVAAALRRGDLQLNAMFLLEDANVFCRYDQQTGDFVALSDSE